MPYLRAINLMTCSLVVVAISAIVMAPILATAFGTVCPEGKVVVVIGRMAVAAVSSCCDVSAMTHL
jgi:hypothetical protein